MLGSWHLEIKRKQSTVLRPLLEHSCKATSHISVRTRSREGRRVVKDCSQRRDEKRLIEILV